MNDELSRSYRRWRLADEHGGDDDADAAFRAVFAGAVPEHGVPVGFAAKTMEAVADLATRDARRARRNRAAAVWIGACGGPLLAYFTAGFIISVASSAITGLLDLGIGVVVGVATGGRSGTDVWSMATNLGRAAAAYAANPAVTFTIFAMQAVAVAALVGLHRLLGSERESLK
jgi:hypothetical protein